MPKVIPSAELDSIVAVIERHHGGVGVAGIRQGLLSDFPARTLQRRLKQLAEQGRIRGWGSGKGKRYLPPLTRYSPVLPRSAVAEPEPALPPRPAVGPAPESGGALPLSVDALEIRDLVCAPLTVRHPVAYDAGFLADYVPNKTFYLPPETRAELARIGRVGVSDLPAGTYVRQVLDRLLIDLSWNSSRLEGNTYSLLETERLIQLGEGTDGRGLEETRMILNHKAAIEMLAEQAHEIGFNRYTICNLHALLSDSLLADPNACGRVRLCAVGISGTVFHPLAVPQLVEDRFMEILEKAELIEDPFEQAFFAMVQLPYLQPFEDVNKRVSRLAANIPFVKQNLCPLSFVDVPQCDYINGLIGVYELNRVEYLRDVFVWAYRRSTGRYSAVLQTLGAPDPFRLRHRTRMGEFVRAVVTGGMDKAGAARWIATGAEKNVPAEERARFVELVETELISLHEGSIARYRLRPQEFRDWRSGWR